MSRHVLCVDAGTTLIKAVVFDGEGRELLVRSAPTEVLSPRPGMAEQDMQEVLDAVLRTIAEAVADSPAPIDAIALTAQGDGFWPVDAQLSPAGPAILWNDGRARAVIDAWRRDGVLDEAFRRNGSYGNLGLPNTIMRHLLNEDPHALDGVHAVLTCGSWVFAALTGAVGLHISEASAPWLDIVERRRSPELLALAGLEDHAHRIPDVFDDDELVQSLSDDLAGRLGLPAGVPVHLAPYDVVATAIGGGANARGDAFCILGTTLCTGVFRDEPALDGVPSGLTLLTGTTGPVVRALPTLAGTGVLEWLSDLMGLAKAADLTALAADSEPGAGGVRVWPYLSPAGERAPFLDPDASGVIAGLSLDRTRADLARASFEGLAHVMRECLDAADEPATELVLAGGGAASDLWCRIVADVTGTATTRVADTQVGAKGAYLTLAVALGWYADLDEAAAALTTRVATIEPAPEETELYAALHRDFLDARPSLAEGWQRWSRS